ncbi:hypothetical protein llap_6770 [Limosa lapponica baueri]|uniref:Uncharacterized protein n=1 Tax=Limosa lapponica baueri TaxID=1758121 RepID=A0A2I0UA35_LIMLA|nr:hypothetical protein llap_6770 [Limosa lapponica baueri]
MAPMTGVLEWKDTDSSRRIGWGDEVGVALYAKDQLECMELLLEMDEELTKSLCIQLCGPQHKKDMDQLERSRGGPRDDQRAGALLL